MSIAREMRSLLWRVTKYFLVCGLITLTTMSLTTGKFPPPIKEVYQNISQIQGSMNMAEATGNIVKSREQQKQVMAMLDDANDFSNGKKQGQRGVAGTGVPNANAVSDQARIKALEYEVAYLKAKLARAEWETKQAQTKIIQATAKSP